LDKTNKIEKKHSQSTILTSLNKKPRIIAKTSIKLPIGRGSKGKETAKWTDKTTDKNENKNKNKNKD
jgi:hypothetical protein